MSDAPVRADGGHAPHFGRDDLLRFFDAQGIVHRTLDHPAVFRVEEGTEIKAALPGGHTKNLFLKDKKQQIWLVSTWQNTAIDLKRLPKVIGSDRLSFGSKVLLQEVLGVRAGSVTAFALINDRERRVRFVLDAALLEHDPVNFHPLTNEATTAVSTADFLRFLTVLGVEPTIVDFSQLGADCEPPSG